MIEIWDIIRKSNFQREISTFAYFKVLHLNHTSKTNQQQQKMLPQLKRHCVVVTFNQGTAHTLRALAAAHKLRCCVVYCAIPVWGDVGRARVETGGVGVVMMFESDLGVVISTRRPRTRPVLPKEHTNTHTHTLGSISIHIQKTHIIGFYRKKDAERRAYCGWF